MRLEKWFENGFINYKIKRNSCLYSYTSVGNAELQERHAFHNFFIIQTFRVKKNWEENFEIITIISLISSATIWQQINCWCRVDLRLMNN